MRVVTTKIRSVSPPLRWHTVLGRIGRQTVSKFQRSAIRTRNFATLCDVQSASRTHRWLGHTAGVCIENVHRCSLETINLMGAVIWATKCRVRVSVRCRNFCHQSYVAQLAYRPDDSQPTWDRPIRLPVKVIPLPAINFDIRICSNKRADVKQMAYLLCIIVVVSLKYITKLLYNVR